MQPPAQLSPSAFATCSAIGNLALGHQRPGEVSGQKNPHCLGVSQGFTQHRVEGRAVTAVQPQAAGMGGQPWSVGQTLNTRV